jgi:hypothetical protein
MDVELLMANIRIALEDGNLTKLPRWYGDGFFWNGDGHSLLLPELVVNPNWMRGGEREEDRELYPGGNWPLHNRETYLLRVNLCVFRDGGRHQDWL